MKVTPIRPCFEDVFGLVLLGTAPECEQTVVFDPSEVQTHFLSSSNAGLPSPPDSYFKLEVFPIDRRNK